MQIRRLSAEQFATAIDDLAAVLVDCVEGGASVGFVLPCPLEQASAFWRGKIPAVADGSVVLLAVGQEPVVGTVQLQRSAMPNQRHRGDVAKLLVHRSARG